MTFAVIVQARRGSSRLPDKVLQPIGEKSALLHCLDRCARIPGVDAVVCAVPDNDHDDPVAAEATRGGHLVARGSETDVLARYATAARAVNADLVMRVTSDCPLIDPAICGQVRDLMDLRGVDYAANNLPAAWPHGLDCDVFAAETLYRAEREADQPYQREHVTPWMRTHADLSRANLPGPGAGLQRLRWTLDFPEDLAFFRALHDACGPSFANADWRTLASFCLARPDIAEINAQRVDEARLAPPPAAERRAS